MTRPTRYLLLALLLGILGRSAFLEYTSLVDPTEARYAVVAQHMATSGNWLTPMLPMPEGLIAYLGKPPFHFWLTALSYELFGIDEWTTRLPSLLATMLTLGTIWWFAAAMFSSAAAWTSCLVYLSTAMPFLLAGASVTDVTLTSVITVSVMSLYYFLSSSPTRLRFAYLSAVFAALGFLTKGPICLVLIWFPLLLWSAARRDFSWMKRFPWFTAAALFLAVTSPWFILSEMSNPGFLKYFFWNENIARYLFSEYGDRYGDGHTHWYGMSWVMLACAFAPWIFFLPSLAWRGFRNRKKNRSLRDTNPHQLFIFCAAMSTPLFFTFVRQLHGMYLLPALPALAILTAQLILSDAKFCGRLQTFCSWRKQSMLVAALGIATIIVGMAFEYDSLALAISVLTLAVGIIVFERLKQMTGDVANIARVSWAMICLYLTGIGSTTPLINSTMSSKAAMEVVALSNECGTNHDIHQVGVSSKNAYSHYWTAGAWEEELAEQVNVKYVTPDRAGESGTCHFLLKTSNEASIPKSIIDNFRVVFRSGNWRLYERLAPPA